MGAERSIQGHKVFLRLIISSSRKWLTGVPRALERAVKLSRLGSVTEFSHLATACCVEKIFSAQCVSSWQTGRTIPKPYQMKMLSEILSVPINELFSDVFNKVNS